MLASRSASPAQSLLSLGRSSVFGLTKINIHVIQKL